jgi:hypothetical protein
MVRIGNCKALKLAAFVLILADCVWSIIAGESIMLSSACMSAWKRGWKVTVDYKEKNNAVTYLKLMSIKKRVVLLGFSFVFCFAAKSGLHAQTWPSDYVCVGNQADSAYEVYDPTVTDWNSPSALLWSFTPTTSGGWTSSQVAAYSNPSDMKMVWWGSEPAVVSCASGGLATIATYPGGSMIWALDVGGANNPHSVDLLPSGNIAVAASDGNWVRVYASSQSSGDSTYAQFNLTGAHAVLWDQANNVLWVLGDTELTALSVGGSSASPTLSEVTGDRATLPDSGGHDLSPFYGNSDLLWVTTSYDAYTFQKSTLTFTGAPGSADRSAVKGCGNQPSGEIVQCQIDNSECTLNTWCTPHVNFFTAAGVPDYTRTRTGAAFYKSRVFWGQNLYGDQFPGVAACSMNSNSVAVIWPGYMHYIFASMWDPTNGWVDYGPIQSGNTYYTPAIVSRMNGIMDAFVCGPDSALWQSHYETNTWGPWTSLGGVLLSGPSACSMNSNEWTVVYERSDNAVGYLTWSNGIYSYGSLGGGTYDRPAIVSMTPTTMNVYERSEANALWGTYFNGTNWGSWYSLGGVLTSAPSAASKNANNITIVYRGTGDIISWLSWDTNAWTYGATSAAADSSPGLTSRKGSGSLNAYFLGPPSMDYVDGLYDDPVSGWGSAYDIGYYY